MWVHKDTGLDYRKTYGGIKKTLVRKAKVQGSARNVVVVFQF